MFNESLTLFGSDGFEKSSEAPRSGIDTVSGVRIISSY